MVFHNTFTAQNSLLSVNNITYLWIQPSVTNQWHHCRIKWVHMKRRQVNKKLWNDGTNVCSPGAFWPNTVTLSSQHQKSLSVQQVICMIGRVEVPVMCWVQAVAPLMTLCNAAVFGCIWNRELSWNTPLKYSPPLKDPEEQWYVHKNCLSCTGCWNNEYIVWINPCLNQWEKYLSDLTLQAKVVYHDVMFNVESWWNSAFYSIDPKVIMMCSNITKRKWNVGSYKKPKSIYYFM